MLQKFVKNSGLSVGSSPRNSVLSVIGSDVRILGDIVSQGELQVDGQVDGDITCTTLVVGEGARINGEVTAEHTKVFGELKGKINSSVVTIARSARVVGDVTHEVLEIEAGAFFEGHCLHKAPPPRIEALPAQSESTSHEPVSGGKAGSKVEKNREPAEVLV